MWCAPLRHGDEQSSDPTHCPQRPRHRPWAQVPAVRSNVLTSGLYFYLYNELSTLVVKKTSATTQSVANTAKVRTFLAPPCTTASRQHRHACCASSASSVGAVASVPLVTCVPYVPCIMCLTCSICGICGISSPFHMRHSISISYAAFHLPSIPFHCVTARRRHHRRGDRAGRVARVREAARLQHLHRRRHALLPRRVKPSRRLRRLRRVHAPQHRGCCGDAPPALGIRLEARHSP